MLAFSIDYYGIFFRATQSVELFCTYDKLDKVGYFSNKDCKIRFWELNTELYSCFDKLDMRKQITELLSTYYQSKTLEGRNLQTVMNSKYKNMVLDGIEYYNYSILTPNVQLISELENRGIKYFGTSEENKVEYTPFCYGCIHEDDIPYIIENNISFEEISKYTDGWDSCLPFVDIYKIYDRQDIQNSYMEIIHNSIYARANQRDYLGNWNLLIGNIPEFLYKYEINVDWDRIFNIFGNFLALSLLEKERR